MTAKKVNYKAQNYQDDDDEVIRVGKNNDHGENTSSMYRDMNAKFENISNIQNQYANALSDSQNTNMKRYALYDEQNTAEGKYSATTGSKASSFLEGSVRSTVIKRKVSTTEDEDSKFEEYLLRGHGRKYAQSVYKQIKNVKRRNSSEQVHEVENQNDQNVFQLIQEQRQQNFHKQLLGQTQTQYVKGGARIKKAE